MADEIEKLRGSLRTIVFACEDNGSCQAHDYFETLSREGKALFWNLFRHKSENPAPLRGNVDHKLDGTEFEVLVPYRGKRERISKVLYALKSITDKSRFLYFYWSCEMQRSLVICRGCFKNEDELDPGEIKRATETAKAYILRKAKKGLKG